MAGKESNTIEVKEEAIDEDFYDVTQETKANLALWNEQLIKEEWIDDVKMECKCKGEEGTQFNTDMTAVHSNTFYLPNIKEEPSWDVNEEMESKEAGQRAVKLQKERHEKGNHSQCTHENIPKRNAKCHKDKLNNRFKKGKKEKLHECDTCNYKGKFKYLVKNHIARVHKKQKKHFSNNCSHGFYHKGHLRTHQMIHSGEKPGACDKCGKRFRRKDSLKLHQCPKEKASLEISCLRRRKIITCGICNLRFMGASSLEKHMRIHTKKIFTCYVCNYTCRKKNDLRLHVSLHMQENLYFCSTCERTYTSAKDLKRHEYKHKQTILMCDECAFTSTCSSSLRTHIRRKHTGEKPFSCKYCDYKCVKMGDLRRHEAKHTGLKLFACDYCDYKSNRHDVLVIHIRTHTGEKPYICDICHYACAVLSNLKQHKLTHHVRGKNQESEDGARTCSQKSIVGCELKLHLNAI